MAWQPIDTAPKDGTVILAVLDFQDTQVPEMCPVKWHRERWEYGYAETPTWIAEHVLTHWMSLPPLPTTQSDIE